MSHEHCFNGLVAQEKHQQAPVEARERKREAKTFASKKEMREEKGKEKAILPCTL